MFEISLVPEVKAKLLRQERIRNLVIVICIFTAIGCGVIIAGLVATSIALSAKLSSMDDEIACRIDSNTAKKTCSGTGTAIMQTANLNEMLSIQNELNNIGTLNMAKSKPSRLLPSTESLLSEPSYSTQVFSMLEIVLPSSDDYTFKTSEFQINFEESTMNYDVVAHAVRDKSQENAYVNFKANLNESYFDYGDYIMTKDDGTEEVIPTYCIGGEKIIDGQVYGIYNRYYPGCEAPMSTKSNSKSDDNSEGEEETYVYHEANQMYIRRTYDSSEDFESYKNGDASSRSKNGEIISFDEAPKGFYFRSSCIVYGEDGKFDESATRTQCPIVTEKFESSDRSQGRDSETNEKVVTFSVALSFSPEIFNQSSHNVLFYSPSRRTVSTSYTAVEDFFTNPVEDTKPLEDNN